MLDANFVGEIYPNTKARIVVGLATLGQLTARQIYNKLKDLGISYNAVYKAIQELVEKGILLKAGVVYTVNQDIGIKFINLGRRIKGIFKSPDLIFVQKFENIISQMIELRENLGKVNQENLEY